MIHITQTAEKYSGSKNIKTIDDVGRVINSIISHIDKNSEKFNIQKNEVMRGQANAGNVIINIGSTNSASGSSGSSTSGGSVSSIQLRGKTVTLLANTETVISFTTPISVAFSIPSIRIVDTNGYQVNDFTITGINANGFTITTPVDSTLYYLAVGDV